MPWYHPDVWFLLLFGRFWLQCCYKYCQNFGQAKFKIAQIRHYNPCHKFKKFSFIYSNILEIELYNYWNYWTLILYSPIDAADTIADSMVPCFDYSILLDLSFYLPLLLQLKQLLFILFQILIILFCWTLVFIFPILLKLILLMFILFPNVNWLPYLHLINRRQYFNLYHPIQLPP